jgi:hypothetical protein
MEKIVKTYSSEKLKEIIEPMKDAYSEKFIDCAKDELIKRGVSFPLNPKYGEEVSAMNDDELRKAIEEDFEGLHEEYLEVIRHEFLKRKLIHQNPVLPDKPGKYGNLSMYAELSGYLGSFALLVTAGTSIISFINDKFIEIAYIASIGIVAGISLYITSGLIKVLMDIEKNTRQY